MFTSDSASWLSSHTEVYFHQGTIALPLFWGVVEMKGYWNFDGHMCLATLYIGGRQVPILAYVCLCDTDLHACLLACMLSCLLATLEQMFALEIKWKFYKYRCPRDHLNMHVAWAFQDDYSKWGQWNLQDYPFITRSSGSGNLLVSRS